MDNKKIKVLIGDDSAEYGITCANELRALGLYVVTRRKDGKVILDAIRNDTPCDPERHAGRCGNGRSAAWHGCHRDPREISDIRPCAGFHYHVIL